MRLCAVLFTAATMIAAPAAAQDSAPATQSGPDLSIAAIEPDGSAPDIGLAGEQPADIARYLLASGAGNAELSPDGQTIAFAWAVTGEDEIWTMPAAGGQPTQLTFRTAPDFFRWTPDGSGILYSADRDGNEQPGYFIISADGTEERAILPAAEGDFRNFGDFVGEDGFIYSSTLRNGNDFDIYRADFDGNSELIYEGSFGFYVQSVSPDGRYAVVTRNRGRGCGQPLSARSAQPRADHRQRAAGGGPGQPFAGRVCVVARFGRLPLCQATPSANLAAHI